MPPTIFKHFHTTLIHYRVVLNHFIHLVIKNGHKMNNVFSRWIDKEQMSNFRFYYRDNYRYVSICCCFTIEWSNFVGASAVKYSGDVLVKDWEHRHVLFSEYGDDRRRLEQVGWNIKRRKLNLKLLCSIFHVIFTFYHRGH